ncbi:MAG TPA: sigma-70 family RNA polymerase sigma factor [Terriglobales bacterium]|nr:sigma-70 family RNA polymerase sigma factor [Terriglobales bacterium]
MASAPSPEPVSPLMAMVRAYAAEHFADSGAARFGIDVDALAAILSEVIRRREAEPQDVLPTLRLEELVLARACLAGHDGAWELFLTRYRAMMYEAAYAIAHDETAARGLADSLYAELYGVNAAGEARASKLRYYLGRGSLAGWLRTVIAQEYVNRYRRTRRETSLDAALEEGAQFAAPASQAQAADARVEAAASAELAALPADERFLLAAYYLDRRTLAEIARLLHVHESTVSRKLERVTAGLRKRIRKRLIGAGMSTRQADEAIQDTDVRDLRIEVGKTLEQDRRDLAFYKKSGEEG